MQLTYEILLMVVLSTTPDAHELYFYQYPTWADCKAHEIAMRAELVDKTRNPQTVTISCRHHVVINAGTTAGSVLMRPQ